MLLPQLKRIRWAVRATLILGVAASVAANILHARQNPISQTISAWPPLALLLTVELTSRIPMHKRSLAAVRILATVVIAGIAAWVSYWHMQGVATKFGEEGMSPYLLPISVDGLIVVASVCLVELGGRIRFVEEERTTAIAASRAAAANPQPAAPQYAAAQYAPAPQFAPPAPAAPVSAPAYQSVRAAQAVAELDEDDDYNADEAMGDDFSDAPVSPAVGGTHSPLSAPMSASLAATTRPAPAYVNGSSQARPVAAVSAPARTMVTATTLAAESSAPRQRRPVIETADLAAEIEAMHPEISQSELARRLGISATRLRAVRREARELRRTTTSRH